MEYKYHKAAILLGITTPTWQRSGACALCFGGGLRKEAKMSTNGALKRGRYGTVRTLAIKRGLLTHEVDKGSNCLICEDGCPGFDLHFWRKVCAHCLHTREQHDIKDNENIRGVSVGKILFAPDAVGNSSPSNSPAMPRGSKTRLSINPDSSESPLLLKKEKKYLWVPKNINRHVAEKYMLALPRDKCPIQGTPGERYRNHQLIRQLAPYDIDLGHMTNDLSVEEEKQMELFLKMRRETALGRGNVKELEDSTASELSCLNCKNQFESGDVAVFADVLGVDAAYHVSCFTCYQCEELLIDLIYFTHEGKIYCGRHHAEIIKPRCSGCDELILCLEYTRAEGKDWHLHHFKCINCDASLGGQKYVVHGDNYYCLVCNEKYFTAVCMTCGKAIKPEDKGINHNDMNWHATKACFFCSVCHASLVGKSFLPKKGLLLCSKDCSKVAKVKGWFLAEEHNLH